MARMPRLHGEETSRERSRISSASSSAAGPPPPTVGFRRNPAWTMNRRDTAVDSRRAADVLARLASGLDTQLGPTWPMEGAVLWPWPEVALAPRLVDARQQLLLILDEANAALDAKNRTSVFERYAAAARATDTHRTDSPSWSSHPLHRR